MKSKPLPGIQGGLISGPPVDATQMSQPLTQNGRVFEYSLYTSSREL